MGKRDYYKIGDHNVICDRCGAKFKASECDWETRLGKKTYYVCSYCWCTEQPQDYVRGLADKQAVGIARPRTTVRFIDGVITAEDL